MSLTTDDNGFEKPINSGSDSLWTANRIRNTFLNFFERKSHVVVSSSSLLPVDDPSLLFTNAGMNQFKQSLLGKEGLNPHRIKRACSYQKCIRAGGKHNDLDDVGRDVYHHTFFEMLGNWSFGDYFKADAIKMAWELLTTVFQLSVENIYVTYFDGTDSKDGSSILTSDTETRDLWMRFLPASRILPFGTKDNFWEMGETGPCGPCSEIHFDLSPNEKRNDRAQYVNANQADMIEIWNLVFVQYNRCSDGTLESLPDKHVDTGMGLERMCNVLQKTYSNYRTDLFSPILDSIQHISGAPPYSDKLGDADVGQKDMAYRIVADHIKMVCFAIGDGINPGKDGREYVLRRVLRRAIRAGAEKLHAPPGFCGLLSSTVVDCMSFAYPELAESRQSISDTIGKEETKFRRTLNKGLNRFNRAAQIAQSSDKRLDAETAFQLWDSFGFPLDLTQQMASEKDLSVDFVGFEEMMTAQRLRSLRARKNHG